MSRYERVCRNHGRRADARTSSRPLISPTFFGKFAGIDDSQIVLFDGGLIEYREAQSASGRIELTT